MPKTKQRERLTEPCYGGAGCPVRLHCRLYDPDGTTVHGWMDSDEGWVCEEYQVRAEADLELDIW